MSIFCHGHEKKKKAAAANDLLSIDTLVVLPNYLAGRRCSSYFDHQVVEAEGLDQQQDIHSLDIVVDTALQQQQVDSDGVHRLLRAADGIHVALALEVVDGILAALVVLLVARVAHKSLLEW
mmetsp:Transcript_32094/g.77984  ORF Transcript_32094/g.77984 Transcript_32094/m.77984 type:complete len:122 (-) Transcript_32094:294-659(-)